MAKKVPSFTIMGIDAVVPNQIESMVYLLVAKQGKTFREVSDLPFGMSHENARKVYYRAAEKIQKLVAAGLVSPDVEE